MAQKQFQARAEFDFDAQPASGELSIRVGEILTILREGIDGGWVEGKNAKGKVGLFPASYISKVNVPPSSNAGSGPPPTAPPPLPLSGGGGGQSTSPPLYAFPPPVASPPSTRPSAPTSAGGIYPTISQPSAPPPHKSTSAPPPLPGLDAWDDPSPNVVPPSYATKNGQTGGGGTLNKTMSSSGAAPPTLDDDFDDDWSDEDEEVAEFTGAHSFAAGAGTASKMVARSRSTGPETASMSTSGKVSQVQGGTTKIKNFNRFSNFVKTGMEGYVLATSKFTTPPGERHEIVQTNTNGASKVEWHRPAEHYTCMITKPKKESKLKGLKSFIAYSLTSSQTGIQVSRRYKHFDWLHLQLSNKYLLIPIPPLPEKQVAGRYEEDLIEHRRSILQLWVNKICRHPVLGHSEVWRHFMTCTDEPKWKKGKRQAERDEYVGGNFFNCVSAPPVPLDSANVERQIEQFARCSRSLDESCRLMYERVAETQKRLIGPYKANWQKMAGAFDALGQSLELDQSQPNNPVKYAIKTSAHVLHQIGGQYEDHGRKDLEQLLDFIFVAKGIFGGIPDIVGVHKTALTKVRENERLQNEGKIAAEDAEQIRHRIDVCSHSMLAEMQHQQEERDLDLATMFGAYFSQQAAFYHNIGNQLTQLASLYKPAK